MDPFVFCRILGLCKDVPMEKAQPRWWLRDEQLRNEDCLFPAWCWCTGPAQLDTILTQNEASSRSKSVPVEGLAADGLPLSLHARLREIAFVQQFHVRRFQQLEAQEHFLRAEKTRLEALEGRQRPESQETRGDTPSGADSHASSEGTGVTDTPSLSGERAERGCTYSAAPDDSIPESNEGSSERDARGADRGSSAEEPSRGQACAADTDPRTIGRLTTDEEGSRFTAETTAKPATHSAADATATSAPPEAAVSHASPEPAARLTAVAETEDVFEAQSENSDAQEDTEASAALAKDHMEGSGEVGKSQSVHEVTTHVTEDGDFQKEDEEAFENAVYRVEDTKTADMAQSIERAGGAASRDAICGKRQTSSPRSSGSTTAR
ncbi:hypothetical protein BESB_073530 [Besnoitia besnoiti]|uniref:Uncharacterized protein n=1 Tax=Besnoitia besnoiti TaxID=94643 RepID=A0A2A9MD26_BESBE|nr:uncharacterized protein BESB_073530 [Besnoitia besnoiti]PFH34201.1 hypothetical protein BESB_073530 [Besnoitia besnoiti]